MPRNGSGSYTLPEPPFVPNTVISSAAVNSDFSDIADAITASLARDGQGGMTAVLPLDASGFSYVVDPDTGIRRTAANTQAIRAGGTDVVTVDPNGADITGNLNVTGEIQKDGVAILPIGLGPLPWSGSAAPTGWVLAYGQTLSRSTYASLWAFAQVEIAAGNTLYNNGNGTTTFGIADLRGRVVAGKDNMGGSAAGRLTSTTMTPDGGTLGAVGGTQTHTLIEDELAVHKHENEVSDDLGFSFKWSAGTAGGGGGVVDISAASGTQTVNTVKTGAVSITNEDAGGGDPHNNVQPTIVANFIIYAGV